MIWNWTPKPGETASWAGDRDKENYASGFGDLTWYNAKGKVFALYYGNMVHGKFEGAVNVHSSGRTAHAYFVDGGRVTGWAHGPAPAKMSVPEGVVAEKRKAEAESVTAQKRSISSAETAKKPKAEPEAKPEEKVQRSQINNAEKPAPEAVKKEPPPIVAEKQNEAPTTPSPGRPFDEPTTIPAKSEAGSEPPSPSYGEPRKSEVSRPTESSAPTLDTRVTESAPPSIKESPPVRQESPAEQKPEIAERTPETIPESSPAPAKKESPADVSVNALVGPPSSLRTTSIPATSSEKSERRSSSVENVPLTEAEAISLADTEARVQGYSLDDYERPKVDHSKVKGRWTLFYGLKKTETGSGTPAALSITVEDKSRKVEIRK